MISPLKTLFLNGIGSLWKSMSISKLFCSILKDSDLRQISIFIISELLNPKSFSLISNLRICFWFLLTTFFSSKSNHNQNPIQFPYKVQGTDFVQPGLLQIAIGRVVPTTWSPSIVRRYIFVLNFQVFIPGISIFLVSYNSNYLKDYRIQDYSNF